jgi:PIN domain nuclease of toxin-antitoxin system
VNDLVADASAIIALLVGEKFRRFNPADLNGTLISSVNLAEVLTRLPELGVPEDAAEGALAELNLRVIAFNEAQARATARLRPATRRAGLSLGDRACLALADAMGCPAVTADRVWGGLDVGVDVVLIR